MGIYIYIYICIYTGIYIDIICLIHDHHHYCHYLCLFNYCHYYCGETGLQVPCLRERGSAPKRGRHATICFSTKCIRAVAACWFDNPHQKVVPRNRIPRSTSHFSQCLQPLSYFRGISNAVGPSPESYTVGSFGAPFFGTRSFVAAWHRRVRQKWTVFSNPPPTSIRDSSQRV